MWLAIAIILVVLGLIVWATTRKSRLGHWARIAVSIMSGGFIFPHSMTEDDKIAKHDANKSAKVETQ